VQEPCYYIPSLGESWPVVATTTSYRDSCRWPEIANLNRAPDGTYRIIGSVLARSGILVPPPLAEGAYPPIIRQTSGRQSLIPECPHPTTLFDLPCTYVIREEDGLTGLNYLQLAYRFYGTDTADGEDLEARIMSANLEGACPQTSVRLFPGVSIVIPALP
jgi:hypothetical protein